MKPIKHFFILSILLLAALTTNGQDGKVTLSFDCQQKEPTLTLNGDGVLYHYNRQNENYKGTYYLFTDVHTIGIDPSSMLFDKNAVLAFKGNDKNSKWFSDTTCLGNDYRINNSRLQNAASKNQQIFFEWGERAYLLISSNSNKQPIENKTLFLIVLPSPPEDTLIAEVESSIIMTNDSINGQIIIRRTGRVIIDSVYVEGEKAYTTFNPKQGTKDEPYYRKTASAQVEIHRPWDKHNKDLNLTVFMKRFNNDGTLSSCQEDLQLTLFKKSPFSAFWWFFAILILAILTIAVWSILKHKNGGTRSGSTKRNPASLLKRLREENDRLKKELEDAQKAMQKTQFMYKEQIDHLKKENEQLKRPTQAAIDEATFIKKCDTLFNEIEIIREELKDNPEMQDLDAKLRNLQKTVIIVKQ